MDPSATSPPEGRGGQRVLVGHRRKNWTHPPMSWVYLVPSLGQHSPGKVTRGEGWGHDW